MNRPLQNSIFWFRLKHQDQWGSLCTSMYVSTLRSVLLGH
jgi:hypothetical protein